MAAAILGVVLPLGPVVAEAAPLHAAVPVVQYAGTQPEPQQNDQQQDQGSTNDNKGMWGLLGLFGLLGLLGLVRRAPKPPKSDVVPEPRPARRPSRPEGYEDPAYSAQSPADAATPLNNPVIYPNATAGGYPPPEQAVAGNYPPPEQTAPPTGAAPEGRRRRF
ncbi:hypothetical protein GCM10027097_63600 [Amycolatopsis acidiphila]